MQVTHLNTDSTLKSLDSASAVAFGNFDGVHIGHQEIIKNCVLKAREQNLTAVAITFAPHPRQILQPQSSYTHLCSLDEKLQHMKDIGIEHAVVMAFDKALSMMTPSEFALTYLKQWLHTKWLFTGYNFHFGHMRAGDPKWLARHASNYGFAYTPIEEISRDYQSISSTNIKNLLKLGMVKVVKDLLGRPFTLGGKVVTGKKLASSVLEAPTANIVVNEMQDLPILGVYLVRAKRNDAHLYGICNIGIKPTFKDLSSPLMEVHFFDLKENLYDQHLEIEFLHFIRPERRFTDVTALKYQITHDIKAARYAWQHLDF